MLKNLLPDAGSAGSISESGRLPWRRAWQPTCLEKPMDIEAWWATVHRVYKESDITDATLHSQGTLGFTHV